MKINENKVALISGASSGMGRATAKLLAARGYQVYGTSRHGTSGRQDRNMVMLELDVCDPASIIQGVRRVYDEAGRIDVLINNAGYVLLGGIEETNDAESKAQFETNYFGLVGMTNAVLPIMRAQGQGRIINISSLLGLAAIPFLGHYSASKFAVEGYTEALYHEVMPFGVRVCLIEPGFVHTSMWDHGMLQTAKTITDYAPWRQQAERSIAEHAEHKATEVTVAARKIVKAIEADKPAFRYPVGSDANLISRLKKLIPAGVFASIMRREFGLNKIRAAA